MKPRVQRPDCGFVFAATGPEYVVLAVQAAHSLKAKNPDFPIDLFTDQSIADPVFDRIVALERIWFRPKIEALIRSRFAKTVYLDADIFVVADISDIFDVLDRFDLAVAQDQPRNFHKAPLAARLPIPAAFPLLNSGVMAVRKTPAITAFLHKWQAAMLAESAQFDQPILREMLFCDGPHFAVLPPEYNLMALHLISAMNAWDPAPRIIHSPVLHRHIGSKKRRIGSLENLLGPEKSDRLAMLLAADRTLNPGNNPVWFGQPAYVKQRMRNRRTSLAKSLGRWLSARLSR